jgi:16S rRNA (uracil1498-N3)-methyltransferase
VDVTDGAGLVAQCVVAAARPGSLDLAVLSRRTEPEPRCRIVVVQAILKGDRGELAVELMTEVGVDLIVPWPAERCVARWRPDRADKALDRWRSCAREAAKQSRRSRFPVVAEQAPMSAVAGRVADASLALLLDPAAPAALHSMPLPQLEPPPSGVSAATATATMTAAAATAAMTAAAAPTAAATATAAAEALDRCDIVLIIGPEGGVSPDETAVLTAAGAVPVRLGPTVLRGSTAGAIAAAIVLGRCGRWA